MAAVESSSNLVELIQKLETQKTQHAAAAAAVTSTLGQISGLLGALIGGQQRPAISPAAFKAAPRPAALAKTSRPSATPAVKAPSAASGAARTKFTVTGDESVLAFIKRRGNPTTAEVQAQWTSEGRGASADNSLSKLYKDKKIKREPNKQGRGSRYSVA